MTKQTIDEISKKKEDNIVKLCPNLTIPQGELLIGSLLGDANLQSASKTAGTWRARFLQGEQQKDYLYYKYEVLKPFAHTEPRSSSYYDRRTQRTYSRYSFNTLTFPQLKPIAKMFYTWNEQARKFVKTIPENIGDYLSSKFRCNCYLVYG